MSETSELSVALCFWFLPFYGSLVFLSPIVVEHYHKNIQHSGYSTADFEIFIVASFIIAKLKNTGFLKLKPTDKKAINVWLWTENKTLLLIFHLKYGGSVDVHVAYKLNRESSNSSVV